MSLDFFGFLDPIMESTPSGGINLVTVGEGGYTGPGGTWVDGAEVVTPLTMANIQQANMRTAQYLMDNGMATHASDSRVVYINDGTTLNPSDDGTYAQILRFSDGSQVRDWKVVEVDNRPWRNYCKAIVTRYRGER